MANVWFYALGGEPRRPVGLPLGLSGLAPPFWETTHVIHLLLAKVVLQYSESKFHGSELCLALCFGSKND